MLWFSIATMIPVLLLALAGLSGGVWCLIALLYLTGFTYLMDRLVQGAAARRSADGNFPWARNWRSFLALPISS